MFLFFGPMNQFHHFINQKTFFLLIDFYITNRFFIIKQKVKTFCKTECLSHISDSWLIDHRALTEAMLPVLKIVVDAAVSQEKV